MSVRIFKSIYSIVSYPLSKIINVSFQSGIFPDIFKIARLTPIFKVGDKEDISNYRPISSLHYISKIFERCVKNRLISFCAKFNIVSTQQFGFLKGKSTADALIDFSEFNYDALDAKKHCANVLIDLKKAFDRVYLILLKKLELYGIRGIPLNWFRSFLGNRDCFVGIGNINSDRKLINIGVPQGSILGPILFLVYINDLPNISNLFHATLYADDTTISVSDQNATSLINNTNFVLEKIDNWSIANRLTINTSKTELILTTNRLDDCTGRPDVILRGTCVDSSSYCKFLRVIVDAKLSFKQHIGHVVIKI